MLYIQHISYNEYLNIYKDFLKDSLSNTEMKFDITSCQFALHYGFESYAQVSIRLTTLQY